jgi:hypothetical protein
VRRSLLLKDYNPFNVAGPLRGHLAHTPDRRKPSTEFMGRIGGKPAKLVDDANPILKQRTA